MSALTAQKVEIFILDRSVGFCICKLFCKCDYHVEEHMIHTGHECGVIIEVSHFDTEEDELVLMKNVSILF